MQCPKCGSDQVINDQCLKCGIVVSKFAAQTSTVSFVAPPAETSSTGYRIPQATVDHRTRLKKTKLQTQIIGIVMVLALIGSVYGAYRFLTHRAAAVSSLFKNQKLNYAMRFPETGSKWNHYSEGDPGTGIFKGAEDA